MCGRVVVKKTGKEVASALGLSAVVAELDRPNYNLAPTKEIPVVANTGGRELDLFRWGLVPAWAKDLKSGPLMNNARAETLAEKKTFARLLEKRRCLVVVDAFYEWKRVGEGKNAVKTPYAIRRKDGLPLVFAGLWDQWESPDGHLLRSCTIITTGPNKLMATIHDRMPVLVEPATFDLWLSPDKLDTAKLLPLLQPAGDDLLELYQVAPLVNSVKNHGPELLDPVTPASIPNA